jgi:hydrogenase nickel incorporation protein HypA/HybF
MHEISLVKNIFGSLDSVYKEQEQTKIKTIHLTVGLLSNVEPVLMQNAYEAVVATERQVYKNCRLEIKVLPILIECTSCKNTSEIQNYIFKCAHCQKPDNNVIQGNELLISGVEMEE